MEMDYSKPMLFWWKIKWRLEHLGAIGIMGETAPFLFWKRVRTINQLYKSRGFSRNWPTTKPWQLILHMSQATFIGLSCSFPQRLTKVLQLLWILLRPLQGMTITLNIQNFWHTPLTPSSPVIGKPRHTMAQTDCIKATCKQTNKQTVWLMSKACAVFINITKTAKQRQKEFTHTRQWVSQYLTRYQCSNRPAN